MLYTSHSETLAWSLGCVVQIYYSATCTLITVVTTLITVVTTIITMVTTIITMVTTIITDYKCNFYLHKTILNQKEKCTHLRFTAGNAAGGLAPRGSCIRWMLGGGLLVPGCCPLWPHPRQLDSCDHQEGLQVVR